MYGALLILAGAGVVVVEAIRSSSNKASGTEIAVLIGLGSVLQIAGGGTFGRGWRVEPNKAKGALRTLRSVGREAGAMHAVVAGALENGGTAELRRAAQTCEYGLAAVMPKVENAMRDWDDIHPEMMETVLNEKAPRVLFPVFHDDVEELPGV